VHVITYLIEHLFDACPKRLITSIMESVEIEVLLVDAPEVTPAVSKEARVTKLSRRLG
jgi:hypothetical protein